MEMLYAALGYADAGESVEAIAHRFSISTELVQRWLDRAQFFCTVSSGKGKPRLIDPSRLDDDGKAPLQPFKRFNAAEYELIEQAFRWAPRAYHDFPDRLMRFLNLYLKKATGSRSMLTFRPNEEQNLLTFLDTGIDMLSADAWRLFGPTKKRCNEIKKTGGKNWKKLVIGEPPKDYYGFKVSLRSPNEEQRLEAANTLAAYSSGALRYIVRMLLIAWPGTDVGKRKLLRDPFTQWRKGRQEGEQKFDR